MRKFMKYTVSVAALVLCLLIPGASAKAGNLIEVNAENFTFKEEKKSGFAISGEVEPGVTAIAVTVYDKEEKIVGILSTEVFEDSHFWRAFEFAAGEYILKVADYNGGNIVTMEVVVVEYKEPCEHDWEGEVVKAPTCTEKGLKKFTCKLCKEVEEQDIDIDPEAHVWDEGVEKDGKLVFTCKNCKKTKTEDLEEKLPEAEQKVVDFTSRLYTVALGRTYDEKGLKDWSKKLLSHEIDGAAIAHGFIMSDEFQAKKLTDEQYVDVLYETFLGRAADPEGKASWLKVLADGSSREKVLAGFVNSTEFDNIAEAYGIVAGYMYEDGSVADTSVHKYVERLYSKALNRDADKPGLQSWYANLVLKVMTPKEVAKAFLSSEEFQARKLSEEEYVDVLYQTFMDRAADPEGKAAWTKLLTDKIMTREQVLYGFIDSDEFAGIIKKFGL